MLSPTSVASHKWGLQAFHISSQLTTNSWISSTPSGSLEWLTEIRKAIGFIVKDTIQEQQNGKDA